MKIQISLKTIEIYLISMIFSKCRQKFHRFCQRPNFDFLFNFDFDVDKNLTNQIFEGYI